MKENIINCIFIFFFFKWSLLYTNSVISWEIKNFIICKYSLISAAMCFPLFPRIWIRWESLLFFLPILMDHCSYGLAKWEITLSLPQWIHQRTTHRSLHTGAHFYHTLVFFNEKHFTFTALLLWSRGGCRVYLQGMFQNETIPKITSNYYVARLCGTAPTKWAVDLLYVPTISTSTAAIISERM